MHFKKWQFAHCTEQNNCHLKTIVGRVLVLLNYVCKLGTKANFNEREMETEVDKFIFFKSNIDLLRICFYNLYEVLHFYIFTSKYNFISSLEWKSKCSENRIHLFSVRNAY